MKHLRSIWAVLDSAWPVVLAAFGLCLIGWIGLLNTSLGGPAYLAKLPGKQALWLLLGFGAAVGTAMVDPHFWTRRAEWLLGLTVLLLGAALAGPSYAGQHRWIGIGWLTVRPAELAKVALVLALARLLAAGDAPREERGRSLLVLLLAGLGVLAAILLVQPDLASLVVCLLVAGSVLCVARPSWRTLLGAGGSGLLVIAAMWLLALHDYQRHRLLVWLHLRDDPHGAGWIAQQSMRVVQSGGLFGSPAQRTPFFPDAQTDFVYTAWSRDHGLFGSLALIGLVALLVVGSLRIAARAKQRDGQLLALGLAALGFWQAFLSIGMALGLTPILTVPLPLCSYGGTSIVTTLALLGIVVRVAAASAAGEAASTPPAPTAEPEQAAEEQGEPAPRAAS
jgi:rod shape determining protein RodA